MKRLSLLFLLLLAAPLRAEDTQTILRDWISKQVAIRSLRADFIQTRRLPALRIPLKKSGTVWFGTEGRFRWQDGDPADLLVLKSPNDFLVIEPKKSLARRFSASSAAARAMQELPMPIAISLDEFQRRFEVVSLKEDGARMDLRLTPKDPRLAEGLKSLRILFDPASGAVSLFEMTFRDGSEVSTEFTRIERNPTLPAELFQHDLRDFKIEDQS
ncbi:MAG: outer membrane lipoprotein carrier protein LolA [Verrucomicrobia bacterium]|nr:outer membrane lipoprotein carrier protein LolA [Verrucomicrobiota bacterium]